MKERYSMCKYTDVVVGKDNLLAFFAKPTNGFKNHYVSSQPMNIHIPYTEYAKLVQDVVVSKLEIMRSELEVYESVLQSNPSDHVMLRSFLYDIAQACLAEVYKSHRSGFPCTRLYALFDEQYSDKVEIIAYDEVVSRVNNYLTPEEFNKIHEWISTELLGLSLEERVNNDILSSRIEDNIVMYYYCVALLGNYVLKKDVLLLHVKED